MRYEFVKPDRRYHGPVHWGHRIYLYCKEERIDEFRSFLDTVIGPRAWRLSSVWDQDHDSSLTTTMDRLLSNTRRYLALHGENTIAKFADKNHAMRLKLMWQECDPPVGLEILPIIRKVMPQVIAEEIIGVAPMQGPSSDIFTLRTRYQ